MLALTAPDVSAQISGTASLVSNYRFRGISLSGNKPAAEFGIAYDDARDWYAGAFAATVKFTTSPRTELQAIPYLGYTWRGANDVSYDLGASYSAFTGAADFYNYPEIYFGIASGNVSGRVYYSNRYFGQDSGTIYGEVNATQPLLDRTRLVAHVGLLWSNNGHAYFAGPERVFDGRVGIAFDFEQLNVQLSWVATSSASAAYRITGVQSHGGPVLTLAYPF